MEKTVSVHERVNKKRPEISDDDVLWAWKKKIKCRLRLETEPPQYVAAGFDQKGRALEMVGIYDPTADETLIIHARKLRSGTRKELGLDR